MDIQVRTAAGGVYVIKDATAFGPDAVIGHLASDPTDRIFRFAETDTIKEIR
ncbi:hypothetical protein SEA_NEFERTHENA_53 [Microbacterium phage Neferthena]|uniref:Uncharacterized protein n=1 Tax=Microbacterium phage Neferthena TaxID=2301539 RepID=A0A385D3N7_9CAUD|nr:hypothetical protein HOT92_gp49 [Microbacterium phage Neferthena]AXQ52916.1 hypothetical protein SEA_NEFERTHENA_53 [Microbacterium phage Neferthena]